MLEPRIYGPAHYSPGEVRVAYAAGRFLTVWLGGGMQAVLHDADGHQLTPLPLRLDVPGNPTSLELYADGETFIVLWNNHTLGTYATRIDRDGKVIESRTLENANDLSDVAFNGTHFLIWNDWPHSRFTLLDRNLTPVPVPVSPSVLPSSNWTRIFPRSDGFVVVLSSSTLISLTSTGAETARTSLALGCGTCSVLEAEETDGGRMLLILQREQQIFSAVLERDGTLSELSHVTDYRDRGVDSALVRRGSDFQLFLSAVFSSGPAMVGFPLDSNGRRQAPGVLITDTGGATAGASNGHVSVVAARGPLELYSLVLSELRATEPVNVMLAPKRTTIAGLASAGETFLAAWVVESRAGFVLQPAIHFVALDASGAPISPIRIEEGQLIGNKIASSGTEYAFLRYSDRKIIATRVSRLGVKISDTVLHSPLDASAGAWLYRTDASAVWTGKGYLFCWTAPPELGAWHAIHTAFMQANGVATPARVLGISIPPPAGWPVEFPTLRREQSGLAVGWNGSVALLIFSEIQAVLGAFPGYDRVSRVTVAVRLSATGDLIDTAPLELGPRTDGWSGGGADVASDGADFLVSWYNPAATTNELLTVHADLQRFFVGRREAGAATSVFWAGTHYLLTRYPGTHLEIVRLRPDGQRFSDTITLNAQPVPTAIAANNSGRVIVLALESDAVVTYAQDDLLPVRRRAARG